MSAPAKAEVLSAFRKLLRLNARHFASSAPAAGDRWRAFVVQQVRF